MENVEVEPYYMKIKPDISPYYSPGDSPSSSIIPGKKDYDMGSQSFIAGSSSFSLSNEIKYAEDDSEMWGFSDQTNRD